MTNNKTRQIIHHPFAFFDLIRDEDIVNGGSYQSQAKVAYEFRKVKGIMPHIVFEFYDDYDKLPQNKYQVKRILIHFENINLSKDPEYNQNNPQVDFDLYELFQHSFWCKLWHDNNLLENYKFIFWAENIWDELCLLEGKTSISKKDFDFLLFCLYETILDLIENPFVHDKHIRLRNYGIFLNLKKQQPANYPAYYKENWQNFAYTDPARITQRNRLKDAIYLLNEFFMKVKPDYPLERFIYECYQSFAVELKKRKLIMQCEFCKKYISFVKGRKFCTISTEGRDCGKKARNRRYYETRGKERLPTYRKSTQDLRAFYREKGIKK